MTRLRQMLREQELHAYLHRHRDLEGGEFLAALLEYFNVHYSVVEGEKDNIPADGRVVIVANHPLGDLDAIALLSLARSVRPDVRIVGNDCLTHFAPLRDMLLAPDAAIQGGSAAALAAIDAALARDEAVILFPGSDARGRARAAILDRPWRGAFLRHAEHARAPLLPLHISGRNAALFSALSLLYQPLSALLLLRELFRRQPLTLHLRIGELIPWQQIAALALPDEQRIGRIKQQVYAISSRHRPLFDTEKPTARPEARADLRRQLRNSECLGQTRDGKQIFLLDAQCNSPVMREIGRLREIAFRRVGEGSGRRRDLDAYDAYYRQLVLWDDMDLEVVGAYRIGEAGKIVATRGCEGLYSHSLFAYTETMQQYFPRALELGRSFVQPRYWGMRSLDYLWYGIGAYLRRHPDIRYLFGPVSISDSYPATAKNLLVFFYRHYFSDARVLAAARKRFDIGALEHARLRRLFDGADYEQGLRILKEQLTRMRLAIPTLYKQYTEVCELGGARFLDFGVDAHFSNCVDGLVLVDLNFLKNAKRARYIADGATRLGEMSAAPPAAVAARSTASTRSRAGG